MGRNDQAKQRLVDLDIDEVSIVGVPANEKEFALTKNRGDQNMAKKAEGEVVEVADVTSTDAGGNEVTKALDSVNQIVERVLKATGAAPEKPAETTETEEVSKSVATTEEVSPVVALLTKAGLKGDQLDAVVKAISANQEESEEEDEVNGLDLDELATALRKAASLTPKRMNQLKQAYETLKLLIEGIPHATTPATKVPDRRTGGMGDTGIASQMMKSKDVLDLVDAVKSLKGIVEGQAKQIEQLTKARPPSNSEGGDETESPEDGVTKSMWSGVL